MNMNKRFAPNRLEGSVTVITGTPEYLELLKAFNNHSVITATFAGRNFEVLIVEVEKYNDSSYYNSATFHMVGDDAKISSNGHHSPAIA